MDITTETFFDVLFDNKPNFYLDLTYADEYLNTKISLYFSGFDNPLRFKIKYLAKSEKVIFQLKKERSLNKINDEYLLVYVHKLKESLGTFQKIEFEGKTQYCPKKFTIDNYLVTPPNSLNLVDLRPEFQKHFYQYSYYKYSIIIFVIHEIEKIIRYYSEDNDFIKTKQPVLTHVDQLVGFKLTKKIPPELHSKVFKLWNNKIIKTDFINFKMAFTGQPISNPVKIKWIPEHRKKPCYYALFYFLSSGIFEDIPDDKLFLKICFFTFVNATGKDFKKMSFEASYSKFNEEMDKVYQSNQQWKRTVDDIIKRTKLLTKLP